MLTKALREVPPQYQDQDLSDFLASLNRRGVQVRYSPNLYGIMITIGCSPKHGSTDLSMRKEENTKL